MTTQGHYTLELEQTARKHIQTPVSYVGAAKMIWPLASGSTGWASALRHTGVAAMLGLYWLLVTTIFYGMIFGTLFVWIFWLMFTQNRRHRIRSARQAIVARDKHIGSGRLES